MRNSADLHIPTRNLIHCIFVFLCGFLSIYIFYVGLPYNFNADYVIHIRTISQFTFSHLLFLTLYPFTPAWFFMEDIVYLRPLSFLYPKLMEAVFDIGAHSLQYSEAFCCGILCCIIFLIIRKCGFRSIYGWLGVFLFLTFPTNYFAITAFPYFEYFNTLLRFLPILMLGYLTFTTNSSKTTSLLLVIGYYVLVVLAIKLRSSEKILPFIFSAFLALRWKQVIQNIGARNYGFLFIVTLFMFCSVIPLDFFKWNPDPCQTLQTTAQPESSCGPSRKEGALKSFNFKNLYRSLVHNPNSAPHTVSLIKKEPPSNLTESYGIFLGYLFWPILASALFQFLRSANTVQTGGLGGKSGRYIAHFFPLFLLWFIFISAGFGSSMALSSPRYLNFILLPSLLVLFFSLGVIRLALADRTSDPVKLITNIFLGCAFFVTIVTNSAHYARYVGFFGGGMNFALVEAEKEVFQDQFERTPEGHDLYLTHATLIDKTLFIQWHDNFKEKLNAASSTFTPGRSIYILSLSDMKSVSRYLDQKQHTTQLIAQVNFLDAPPLGFQILSKIYLRMQKKSPYHVAVYKITFT